MALTSGQVQVRDLVMGPGTDYQIVNETNPWGLSVRADQSGPRAWNHGSWSGAEFANKRTIPIMVVPRAESAAEWLGLHQTLMAAFAPVGTAAADVEFRIGLGGTEYLLFGRPRVVDPQTSAIGAGKVLTTCSFVATDPLIYSGDLHTVTDITLPSFTGGLSVPFLVPFLIEQVRVGGAAEVTNAGTAETGLLLRIDGPVPNPRVVLQRPDGLVQTLRWPAGLEVASGQWVEIDTAAETAFLNGLVGASVYPGFIDWPRLPPGTSTLLFDAADRDSGGLLDVTWRDAWY